MLFRLDFGLASDDEELASLACDEVMSILASVADVQRDVESGVLDASSDERIARMCELDLHAVHIEFVRDGDEVFLRLE